MIFKTIQLADDWASPLISRDLRLIVASAENLLWRIANRPPCVTNVLENAGKTGTHGEGRAIDFRTTGSGWFDPREVWSTYSMVPYLTMEQAERWRDRINETWDTGGRFESGKEMLPCVLHDVGMGHHLHLQVAPGKRLRRRGV